MGRNNGYALGWSIYNLASSSQVALKNQRIKEETKEASKAKEKKESLCLFNPVIFCEGEGLCLFPLPLTFFSLFTLFP